MAEQVTLVDEAGVERRFNLHDAFIARQILNRNPWPPPIKQGENS